MSVEEAVARLASALGPDWPTHKTVPDSMMASVCDAILAAGVNPTQTGIKRHLPAIYPSALGPGIFAWRRQKGLGITRGLLRKKTPVSVEDFGNAVAPAIATAPQTCMDPANTGRWPAPGTKLLSYLVDIENESLRNCLALFALIESAQQTRSEYDLYLLIAGCARIIGLLMKEQRAVDVTTMEPDDLVYRVFKGEAGKLLSDYQRTMVGKTWFRLRNTFEAYAERLPEAEAQRLAGFFVQRITRRLRGPTQFSLASYKRAQQERVKVKVDAIHRDYQRIRSLTTARLNQVRRLYEAARRAAEHVKKTGKQLPYEFSYEETVFNEGGRGVRQRVFLRLWDYVAAFDRAVALGHKPVYATRMKRRRLEGPFADRGNYHQVEYLRTEALNEQQLAKPFWFLEMYESDVFSSRQDPECARRREEFFRRSGYSLKKSWHIGQGMLSWRRTAWDPWTKLRNAGYGLFLPIDGMYTSSLMAHLIIRLQLVTGARLGEVQQIAQNPDCIKQLVNVGPKSGVRWLLRMVPKGYKQRGTRQNFYIDEATKDHLIELIRFLREKYGSKVLPSVPFPGTGFKADRYLFQWSGQVMPQHYVMSLIRFLLHGIVCSTVDGKPVDVTSHLLRHAFATELASLKVSVDVIAQLLHQRDVNVTKYYSRPTASQAAIAAEAVFVDRIDLAAEILRSPPEIQRMLKDAEGKVGALTEVLGGTCVIGNMCPAKFACVGCVGNAPDPERRHQIQHKRRWAEQQQRWAEKEGMLAEHRQMRQLVEDCDAILREMDVMEKVKADASQLVRIDLAGKVVQSERACSEKP